MRLFAIGISLLFFSSLLWGSAPPNRDSLLHIVKNENLPNEDRMKGLEVLIANYYDRKEPDSSQIFAQQLLDLAIESKDESMRGQALLFLGNAFYFKDLYAQADTFFTNAYSAFEEVQDSSGLAAVINAVGMMYRTKGDFEEAKEQYLAAIAIWERIGERQKTTSSRINLAAIFESQGDIRTSMEHLQIAMEMAVKAGQKRNEGIARNNLANNYKFLGDIQNAAQQYQKALAIYEEQKDIRLTIGTLNNLGLLYMDDGEYNNALKYLNRAYQMASDTELVQSKAMSLSNLGAVYSNQGNYPECLKAFKSTLKILEEYEILFMIPYHELEIGYALLNMGQLDSAEVYLLKGMAGSEKIGRNEDILSGNLYLGKLYLQKGDWGNALNYSKEGLKIAQLNEIPSFTKNFAEQLVGIYKHYGRNKEALSMFELQVRLQDSLYNEENTRMLIRQELQYSFEKKSIQDSLANAAVLAAREADIQKRKIISNALIGLLLLILVFGGFLFSRYRLIQNQKRIIQEEKNKSEAANAKLREIDQSKTRFFTNISHEFRTPLTVIVGMADQITTYPEKWLNKGTSLIKNNAHNLLNLVNQILDLRKLEAGSLQKHFIQANVSKYLRYLLESFHSLAEVKKVALEFQGSNEPLIADYDPEKLQRIVSNLLSNALKFTPEGGTITLSLIAEPEADPPFYQFAVKDTGVGIPNEKLPYIFDRFYQIGETTATSGEGTGIGLALVKELVDLLKGKIEVESKIGTGTTFTVTFPITTQAELEMDDLVPENTFVPIVSEKISKTTVNANLGSSDLPSLLIVEDNPDVMEYLITCLEGQYRLSFAYDGKDGIEKAQASVPDIIISDVMMPRVDGFTLCNTLKTDERTSHIPIVLLTAKADLDSRIEGLERGADAYLAKPFDRRELEVQLKNLLKIRKRLQDRYVGMEPLSPTEDKVLQQEDSFIQRIRAIVLENLDNEKFGVPDLCKEAALSRTQLHNKIKSLTNRSTSHFMRAIRVQKAKELLKQADFNISEIAMETGFSSRSYFYQVFTEETGVSPTKYRENYQSEQ